MSEFKIIKKDQKGNIEKAAITDAVAFYTRFKEPQVIYDEKDLPKDKQRNFEWTVELIVDEDTADAYDETSPKQTATKLLKAQVAKKFKLTDDNGQPDDQKFVEAGLDPKQKKFYSIKKAQRCQSKAGKSLDFLQPRAVQVVDGKPVDITFEKLIGNGSKVDLLLRFTQHQTYGSFSYPNIMKVNKLVEFEEGGSTGSVDDETADFLGGSVEFAEAPAQDGKADADDFDGDDADGAGSFQDDPMPDFGTTDDDDDY